MNSYIARGLALVTVIFSIFGAACTEKRVDDAVLTATIKTRMTADGRISPTRVNVDTLNGEVTLKGEVPTQEEKDAAEEVAHKVEGVTNVNNQITVNPATAGSGVPSGNEMKRQAEKAASDLGQEVKKEASKAILLGEIKARLTAAGYGDISVDVDQGVVTLKGEAPSEKDRIAVEAIVEKIEGVVKVNNQVGVKGPTPAPTPNPTPRK
jgi:hyperosmotically inducible periplasmic protein